MISGCVCCTLLALLTYPFFRSQSIDIDRSRDGFTTVSAVLLDYRPQANISAGQLVLIMGALTGATSLVWLGPIRLLRSVLLPAIAPPAVQQEQSARL